MGLDAYRNLNSTTDRLASSLEKRSSGYRINRAGDASGLGVSRNLDKQVSGLKVATQNAHDGISVAQTAEDALTQVNSMLNRIHDLVVQAANTASSDSTARAAAQNEIVRLRDEIDRIGNTSSFDNQNLLDGSFGTAVRGQLGADQSRFQSTIASLQVTAENVSASESRILDTDTASEMVNFTRDQILLQPGTAMLAQANSAPQTVLRLLE